MSAFSAIYIRIIFVLSGITLGLILITGCEVFEQVRDWGKDLVAESDSKEKDQGDSNDYKAKYFQHSVKWEGETLSIIAGWYSGDVGNWKKLAEANPDINPDCIHIGDKISIPRDLLKTREVLTREYVLKHRKRSSERNGTGERKSFHKEEKAPELFAPKKVPIEE